MRTDGRRASLRPVWVHRVGGRDLAVLHPSLEAAYVRAVAAVAPAIEAGLSDAVAANRVLAASVEPPSLLLRSFSRERASFLRRLRSLAEDPAWLLFADVRACFTSIAPSAVGAALRSIGCDAGSTDEVVAMLERLRALGVRGLPVGPDASAVVANAVLARADREIEAAGARHLRWVDDLVVAVRDPAEALRILRRVGEGLARAGLELNESKTHIAPASSRADGSVALSLGGDTCARRRRVAT